MELMLIKLSKASKYSRFVTLRESISVAVFGSSAGVEELPPPKIACLTTAGGHYSGYSTSESDPPLRK